MKRELKIGDSQLITISDSRSISVPSETKMSISEIVDLFGIYYQTAKRHIRAIEKSGVANGDYSLSCSVEGKNIYPDYYGLEMIIALAFRVQSEKAEIFRRWVCRRAVQHSTHTVFTLSTHGNVLN